MPRLAAFVTESFQGLVSVPIPGTFELPEGCVLLDPQKGPFCWVVGHCAAAGHSMGWIWLLLALLRLLEALLRLLFLVDCIRRT